MWRNNRRVALVGWILYAASWVTPTLDGQHLGAWAFATSAQLGWSLIQTHAAPQLAAGLLLWAGLAANFSILLNWPTWAHVLWIAVPWLPFIAVQCWAPARPDMLYFYPWAIGLGLIHGARIIPSRSAALTDALQ